MSNNASSAKTGGGLWYVRPCLPGHLCGSNDVIIHDGFSTVPDIMYQIHLLLPLLTLDLSSMRSGKPSVLFPPASLGQGTMPGTEQALTLLGE